jgi:hypothetical protein
MLEIVALACPQLEYLAPFTGLISLSYLHGFQNLRTLAFSGYLTSPVDETLAILQNLENLE